MTDLGIEAGIFYRASDFVRGDVVFAATSVIPQDLLRKFLMDDQPRVSSVLAVRSGETTSIDWK